MCQLWESHNCEKLCCNFYLKLQFWNTKSAGEISSHDFELYTVVGIFRSKVEILEYKVAILSQLWDIRSEFWDIKSVRQLWDKSTIMKNEVEITIMKMFIWSCNFDSTVSRHRQARRSPRAPSAGGGANEHTYCHYILTGLWSRVARTPWNTIAAPTGSRNIIRLEYCHSDDACMPLDQSAVNCCLWLLHAKFSFGFGALNNAIIDGFCQCFGKVRLFLPCKFKSQFKILVHKKCTKSVFCLGSICGSREIIFHVKLV